jgi:hypothetical protein
MIDLGVLHASLKKTGLGGTASPTAAKSVRARLAPAKFLDDNPDIRMRWRNNCVKLLGPKPTLSWRKLKSAKLSKAAKEAAALAEN